nr:ATP synthase F0 subunit 8 [Puncturella cf. parvinobilis]
MPQLAPVNWLVIYFLIWLCVCVIAVLLWWRFMPSYEMGVKKGHLSVMSDTLGSSSLGGLWAW